MSRTTKTRLATALTIILIVALSVAGIMARGNAAGTSVAQPTAARTSAPATPASVSAPAAPSVVVSQDDDAYEGELGDD